MADLPAKPEQTGPTVQHFATLPGRLHSYQAAAAETIVDCAPKSSFGVTVVLPEEDAAIVAESQSEPTFVSTPIPSPYSFGW